MEDLLAAAAGRTLNAFLDAEWQEKQGEMLIDRRLLNFIFGEC